jgi:LacI family transcriptional regulator
MAGVVKYCVRLSGNEEPPAGDQDSGNGQKRRRQRSKAEGAGQQAVTVSDVASLARTSTATVSRALNLPEAVSEDVRERVSAAVQKLGYIPNSSARALRQNQTRLIGIVVPTLKYALLRDVL